MKNMANRFSSVIACLILLAPGCSAKLPTEEKVNQNLVSISFEEIDDILVNPGMGFTTFHRLNSDMSPDEYPLTSVAYYRWYWDEIEQEPGQIPFAQIDELLQQAQSQGQKLAFRIMAVNIGARVPQWLLDLGLTGTHFVDLVDSTAQFMPNFDDPLFLEHAERLIRALGEKYNGHAAIDHVDIGFVGHWGEWHTSRAGDDQALMPNFESKKRIIDAHVQAFSRTPVLMLIGDVEGLRYATENGAGWRADCFGDLTPGWNHMTNLYPQHIQQAGIEDTWKTAPVSFESCGDMQQWENMGFDIKFIFDWGLEHHVSTFNNKSQPVPANRWPEINTFLKKMGYRLVLEKIEHAKRLTATNNLSIVAEWKNLGVAPPYLPYRLAYRLRDDQNKSPVLWQSQAQVEQWLPGKHSIADVFDLPETLAPGSYHIDAAILEVKNNTPAIQLAIKSKRSDGWYALSEIQIE